MTSLQTQNDPAAIAVAPGHGSINPTKDTKMNEARNSTVKPSRASRQLLDIENMVNMVKNLNHAIFMACSDLSDMAQVNGLQSICDEVESRIGIICDHLREVREDLP